MLIHRSGTCKLCLQQLSFYTQQLSHNLKEIDQCQKNVATNALSKYPNTCPCILWQKMTCIRNLGHKWILMDSDRIHLGTSHRGAFSILNSFVVFSFLSLFLLGFLVNRRGYHFCFSKSQECHLQDRYVLNQF